MQAYCRHWLPKAAELLRPFSSSLRCTKGRSQPQLRQILNSRFGHFREAKKQNLLLKKMIEQIRGLNPSVDALRRVRKQLPAREIAECLRPGKAVVGQAVCQACLRLVPLPCHLLVATLEKMLMARLSLPSNKANSLMFAVLNPKAHHVYVAAEYGTTVDRVGGGG